MDSLEGGSVYNVIEVVGTSINGWEEAIKNAVDTASKEITNLRITHVVELDMNISEGMEYRARVKLSFKHEIEPETL